jgi:hypothetical protein
MLRPLSWKALAALALLLAAGTAPAQEKPFTIVGAGVATSGLPLPGEAPRQHWSVGVATHLGLYHGDGTVKTDTAVPNPDGTITGEFGSGSPYVFTAANGDRLVCFYGRTDKGATDPGTFELTVVGATPAGRPIVTALFIAEFVVQPDLSTGRFAGATGSWIMYAWTEPFVLFSENPTAYAWAGSGSITFPKKKK